MDIVSPVLKFIGSISSETLKKLPSDILSLLLVQGGTGSAYKSAGSTLSASGSTAEIPRSSIKDNSNWSLLIADASKKEINGRYIDVGLKITQLIKYLWQKIKTEDKQALLRRTQEGIHIGASNIATFNSESEARQLLAIPLIAIYSDAYTANPQKAAVALGYFCDHTVAEMALIYETIIPQPESGPDKLFRLAHQQWEKMKKDDEEIAEMFVSPDGILTRAQVIRDKVRDWSRK